MMTDEEILNEVRSSFRLEGIYITQEQEERAKRLLSGEATLDELIDEIKQKYKL